MKWFKRIMKRRKDRKMKLEGGRVPFKEEDRYIPQGGDKAKIVEVPKEDKASGYEEDPNTSVKGRF